MGFWFGCFLKTDTDFSLDQQDHICEIQCHAKDGKIYEENLDFGYFNQYLVCIVFDDGGHLRI